MQAISTAISKRLFVINAIGLIAEAIPSTIKILNTLEPIAFPSAISTSFFLAATMDVTNSGSDVPTATIVRPTNVSVIPNAIASVLAESTTQSPPKAIPAAPPTILIILTGMDCSTFVSSSVALFRAFKAERIIIKIKIENNTNKIIPSKRPNVIPPVTPSTIKSIAAKRENGISLLIVSLSTSIVCIIAQRPTTTNKLNKLEPLTLLTASELLPCREAEIETAVSGSDVPMATIVRPIIKEGTRSLFATFDAPSTKKSAPFTNPIKPITNNTNAPGTV